MLTKEEIEIAKALRLARPARKSQGEKRRMSTVFHDIVVEVINAMERNNPKFDKVSDREKVYSIACMNS